MNPPDHSRLSETERARLLAEVRLLAGALLQKVWLPVPALAVLQLRVPGKNILVVLDARTGLLAVAPERPPTRAGDLTPRSQATLRAALSGARFEGARFELEEDTQPQSAKRRRAASVRISFTTPLGSRALVAEPCAGAALLLLGAGEKIIWTSSDAGALRRPGAIYPATRELPLDPLDNPAEESSAPPGETSAQIVQRSLALEEEAGIAARRRELSARLLARIKKLERAFAAVEEDAARAGRAETDLRRAELLLPHQGRIPRGARQALVPDWSQLDEESQPRQVALALDPALSATENAARWLKRGKRYQAAKGRIAARQDALERALAAARALLETLRKSEIRDAAGLRALEDLAGAGGSAGSAAAGKRESTRTAERVPYRTFRSVSGARILVGRGARDNDVLTLRVARGNDLWLHARGLQGAHVVVPLANAQAEPDPRTLIEAALLALHFSSARDAEFAEVAWTRRKYVRKPKGAAPGAVTFSQERTLRVRREPERLQALFAAEEH